MNFVRLDIEIFEEITRKANFATTGLEVLLGTSRGSDNYYLSLLLLVTRIVLLFLKSLILVLTRVW